MKIKIDLENSGEWQRIEIFIKNGMCKFSGWDLIKMDEIEELENDLSEIVEKLKQYRGTQC